MDRTDQEYTKAINDLIKLYDEDRLDKCAQGAEELLEDYGMPRYHRMKLLVLLANTYADWEPAEPLVVRAEAL